MKKLINDPRNVVREMLDGLAAMNPGTMVDALQPAADVLAENPAAFPWGQAVAAAEAGAERTAGMTPRLGRASYLGARAVGVPNGGAVAVTMWMRALISSIGERSTRLEQTDEKEWRLAAKDESSPLRSGFPLECAILFDISEAVVGDLTRLVNVVPSKVDSCRMQIRQPKMPTSSR